MLEKPDLKADDICACLAQEYGLRVKSYHFLPIGADLASAVYQITGQDGALYFLKLRQGDLHQASVAVPNYLAHTGFRQVIPAYTTFSGRLWGSLDSFKVILYPYIAGHDGFEKKLSPRRWAEFGSLLRQFHKSQMPSEITQGLQREKFSSQWPGIVKSHLSQIEQKQFMDPVAGEMAAFLLSRHSETRELVRLTELLGQTLQDSRQDFILCHGDIHGWNLLVDESGELFVVDWDTLIFAPKERDLMFIGAGLGDSGYTPQEEEAMFYRGYGPVAINRQALAYYRCQRIIEDIGIYCQQIFMSSEGGLDRRQNLVQLMSNYRPGGPIEVARQTVPA